jgi:predicted ATPase
MPKYTTSAQTMTEITELTAAFARLLTARPTLSPVHAFTLLDEIYDLITAIPFTGGPRLSIVAATVELLAADPERSTENAVAAAANLHWSIHEHA